jgi:hypothetical protein
MAVLRRRSERSLSFRGDSTGAHFFCASSRYCSFDQSNRPVRSNNIGPEIPVRLILRIQYAVRPQRYDSTEVSTLIDAVMD